MNLLKNILAGVGVVFLVAMFFGGVAQWGETETAEPPENLYTIEPEIFPPSPKSPPRVEEITPAIPANISCRNWIRNRFVTRTKSPNWMSGIHRFDRDGSAICVHTTFPWTIEGHRFIEPITEAAVQWVQLQGDKYGIDTVHVRDPKGTFLGLEYVDY